MRVIETRSLRKVYGGKTVALAGLTLDVEAGEVFGFLGPNGAGKTTAVKILTGLVHPTAGEAHVLGRPVGDPAVRARVGFLPEHFRFHEWLTGEEFLDFHGRLYRLDATTRRRRIPELLRRVGLAEAGGRTLRGYSKGMLQRIGIAQALLNEPALVFLDEPTSALDPIGRRDVRDLIRALRAEGVAVFLNSHLLSEVELVCDRVAIVDRGVVVRAGPLADLLRGAAELTVRVDRVTPELRADLGRIGRVLQASERELVLGVSDLEAAPAVARAVLARGHALYALVPLQRSLEEVFVGVVSGAPPTPEPDGRPGDPAEGQAAEGARRAPGRPAGDAKR